MNVKILKVETNELAEAYIKRVEAKEMPSIHENWRFNFNKQLNRLPNAQGYVLITKETPKIIEGCLIFQILEKVTPYMAYLETAPHNKGHKRKYDYVAGCLIAFAFKQSFIQAKGDYMGLLYFDVLEEKKEDQIKLMALYSRKYNARVYKDTTMIIMDEGGEDLIRRYLNG